MDDFSQRSGSQFNSWVGVELSVEVLKWVPGGLGWKTFPKGSGSQFNS